MAAHAGPPGPFGRRALAVDLPGFAEAAPLQPGPVLPQLDAFAAAAVAQLAQDAGAAPVVAGNSLGGCVSLRLGERAHELGIAGIVPVAPAGLEHPAWFRVIEGSWAVRAVLDSPIPLPERAVRAAVGEAYRHLAFARPRAVAREVVSSFTGHHRDRRAVARYLDVGRRLIRELERPFRLAEVTCPVLLVWGGPRPHGPAPRLAAGHRRPAGDEVRALHRVRALPAGRGARPLRPLLLAFAQEPAARVS